MMQTCWIFDTIVFAMGVEMEDSSSWRLSENDPTSTVFITLHIIAPLFKKQIWLPPELTSSAVKPGTKLTGVIFIDVVESPLFPAELRPRQNNPTLSEIAHNWPPPTLRLTTLVKPGITAGSKKFPLRPNPSWLYWDDPQHKTSPDLIMAQVELPLLCIDTAPVTPFSTTTGLKDTPLPSPNCPNELLPQHATLVLGLRMAQLCRSPTATAMAGPMSTVVGERRVLPKVPSPICPFWLEPQHKTTWVI